MNCHSKKRQRTTGNYGKNKITTNIYDKNVVKRYTTMQKNR